MHDDDQTLITRFRYLTGKRPLGGFDSSIDRSFDDSSFDLRGYIRRHGTIGGGSIGDEYRRPGLWIRPYFRPTPPVPMWLDQDKSDLTLIEDRTKPKSRFYRPAYWPGVFGVKPKKPRKPKKKKAADHPAPVAMNCPALGWDDDAPPGASVAFQCDGCKKVVNTRSRIFTDALDYANAIGWLIASDGRCWCPDCYTDVSSLMNDDCADRPRKPAARSS